MIPCALSTARTNLARDTAGEGWGWLCGQRKEAGRPVSCANLGKSLHLQVGQELDIAMRLMGGGQCSLISWCFHSIDADDIK